MAYQSEAELELQFIEQLNSQKYDTVEILKARFESKGRRT